MFEELIKGLPKDGKTYAIVNKKSGMLLTVRDGGRSAYTPLVLAKDTGAAYQTFKLQANNDETWRIICCHQPDMSVDINGASSALGTRVQTYPRNDTPAQRFTLERNYDGSFKISSACSGNKYAICVAGDSEREGASIVQGNKDAASADWTFAEK